MIMDDSNSNPPLETIKQKLNVLQEENEKLKRELFYLKNSANGHAFSAENASTESRFNIIPKIVHDIKNPLHNIKLSTELINRIISQSETLEEENRNRCQTWVKIIVDSCNKAFNFLQSINLMEELNSQTFSLKLEQTDIVRIIIGLLEDENKAALEKNIELNFTTSDQEFYLPVDKKYLCIALAHILNNAVKFTNPGGKVNISMQKNTNGSLTIQITDNGIGIPEDAVGKVFDRFTKVIKQGTAGEPSKGIGLYTAKKIIEHHKGTLLFDSEVNKGTTFQIILNPTV